MHWAAGGRKALISGSCWTLLGFDVGDEGCISKPCSPALSQACWQVRRLLGRLTAWRPLVSSLRHRQALGGRSSGSSFDNYIAGKIDCNGWTIPYTLVSLLLSNTIYYISYILYTPHTIYHILCTINYGWKA